MPTGRGLVAFKKPIELGKEDMYMIKWTSAWLLNAWTLSKAPSRKHDWEI
jgi:hypothetical protein